MPKVKKCRFCGEEFVPKRSGQKHCCECVLLSKLKHVKDINLIEIQRKLYNERHGTYLSYGQFVAMIERLKHDRLSTHKK